MADLGTHPDRGVHPDRSVGFESVLSSGGERRTFLLVIPLVLVVLGLFGFGLVSLSRASNLSSQLRLARQQADESAKAVTERDDLLREARATASVLSEPGRGAAIFTPASPEAQASGVVIEAPAQHALNVYVWGLPPPPAGQVYRLVGTGAEGREQLVGEALTPDNDGRVHLLARDAPEGLTRLELALLPAPAAGAQGTGSGAPPAGGAVAAGANRKPWLTAQLPAPGEQGVAAPAAPRAAPRRGEGR